MTHHITAHHTRPYHYTIPYHTLHKDETFLYPICHSSLYYFTNSSLIFQFNWTVYFEEVLRGTNKSVSSDQKLMILLPDNIKKIVHWLTSKPKR